MENDNETNEAVKNYIDPYDDHALMFRLTNNKNMPGLTKKHQSRRRLKLFSNEGTSRKVTLKRCDVTRCNKVQVQLPRNRTHD